MTESVHKSVLLQEVIAGLNLMDKAVVLDGTFGGGGHTAEILKKFSEIKIIGLDVDSEAIARGKQNFGERVELHQKNFRKMDEVLGERKVDAILLDIGLSSDQLENSGRGFSFMKDEPLLMTLGSTTGSTTSMKENPRLERAGHSEVTAEDVVNDWSEESLEKIIHGYGEERRAKRIARAIALARAQGEIKTSRELSQIIEGSVGRRGHRRGGTRRLHPATKTFQAIRIAVNDELGALEEGLSKGVAALKPSGRMAVISFHSLEDRIVKNYFRKKAKEGEVILINKKPIVSGAEEVKHNPRARSAKLRIIEKK